MTARRPAGGGEGWMEGAGKPMRFPDLAPPLARPLAPQIGKRGNCAVLGPLDPSAATISRRAYRVSRCAASHAPCLGGGGGVCVWLWWVPAPVRAWDPAAKSPTPAGGAARRGSRHALHLQ